MSVNSFTRLLHLSDLPEMMKIERSSFDNPWSAQVMRDSLEAAHTKAIGLEVDTTLIGYIVLSIVLDEAEILSMTIHPDYQGQGYGKVLLTKGIHEVSRLGVKTLYLEVRVNNAVAIHLYEKLGFVRIGIRPRYYKNIQTGQQEDALLMSLSIAESFLNKEG